MKKRQPLEATWEGSWPIYLKARAGELRTRAYLIGISGASSGGHLAMLAAMRPNDPRFSSIALPAGSPVVDASVRCVVMFWPVIDPLGRHHPENT